LAIKPLTKRGAIIVVSVAGLLTILFLQLALSVRQESQTWDEGNHIFAGYRSWTNADFGLNPEHPPLVKLLATVPLLPLPLQTPKLQDRDFKLEAFLDGKEFLYQNDADMILFRTRMAAAVLTLLLALLVFLATKEMFGMGGFPYSNRNWRRSQTHVLSNTRSLVLWAHNCPNVDWLIVYMLLDLIESCQALKSVRPRGSGWVRTAEKASHYPPATARRY